GGALSAGLLDPKGILDRKSSFDPERDLTDAAEDLLREFGTSKEVRAALRNLMEFTRGAHGQFQRATTDLLKTNPAAATAYFVENVRPIREQRDKLVFQ